MGELAKETENRKPGAESGNEEVVTRGKALRGEIKAGRTEK